MIVTLVVAAANNGVIGRAGGLPWRLPADLAHFKATTMGHHVIVGRKTWESIGRALPGRTWIVVTRDPAYRAEGAIVVGTLQAALDHARAAGEDEAMIAGGGELYRHALPLADRIWLTRIDAEVDGDVTFPSLPKHEWLQLEHQAHPADERHAFGFAICRLERAR